MKKINSPTIEEALEIISPIVKKQNRDYWKVHAKEYYKLNKDKIAKQKKKYYTANKRKIAKYNKDYYDSHKKLPRSVRAAKFDYNTSGGQ